MKRNFRKLFLVFAAFLIFAFSLNLASALFQFNGTVTDEIGSPLNNSLVNITIRNMNSWAVVNTNSTTTNASGWFNLSVNNESFAYIYQLTITHRNLTWLGNNTNNAVDYRSKAIPPFPSMMMEMMAGTNFYLVPSGTLNFSAINASGNAGSNVSNGSVAFYYQIKDTKLGYPIADDFTTYQTEVIVHVPTDRNYSILLYPNQSMPVSFNWDNFTSITNYTFGQGLSSYNATTKTLVKKFNLSVSMATITGYINYSTRYGAIGSWETFTVVPYLLEPGNMVHATYGDLPYNLSDALGGGQGQGDFFNGSNGFYNISLPAPAESSPILLFAVGINSTALNGTKVYGGFRNISLSYGTALTGFNFTMYGLFGNLTNITMDRFRFPPSNINISTNKQQFNLVSANNATMSNVSGHIEVTVDYTNYNATEFTWMLDLAQSDTINTANFSVILINMTGIKEMNIYLGGGLGGGAGQFAPKRVSLSAAQIPTNNNITMANFNPRDIDGAVGAGSISMGMYISNSTCDVPNPPSTCVVGGNLGQAMDTFNPMKAIMGGGRLSFRMGTGSILVHYVNVDMLASGPPDAVFDRGTNTNATSGSSFAAAMRFGSSGPTIYDYALLSMPYTETAGSGLNESTTINISIPLFYDDNWNIIWNTTANGSNAGALAGNFSHYSGRQSEWANLTSLTNCINTSITASSQINASTPCYVDMANNRIWLRVPHFSGTGPNVGGSVLAASTTAATTSSGGGSVGTTSFWKNTIAITSSQFTEGYTKEIAVKDRVKVDVSITTSSGGTGSESHYVGVVSLDTTAKTVTINISSTPQQATFSVGDEKKFEVTNDTFYDLSVKLNSINTTTSKVNITIKSIHEEMPKVIVPAAQNATTNVTEEAAEAAAAAAEKAKANLIWLWILVAVIIILAIILIIVGSFYKKKRYSKKGY